MRTEHFQFNEIVEQVYGLTLEDKLELKNLLEHNISDSKRDEILKNFNNSKKEMKNGKLKFSSNIMELKKML